MMLAACSHKPVETLADGEKDNKCSSGTAPLPTTEEEEPDRRTAAHNVPLQLEEEPVDSPADTPNAAGDSNGYSAVNVPAADNDKSLSEQDTTSLLDFLSVRLGGQVKILECEPVPQAGPSNPSVRIPNEDTSSPPDLEPVVVDLQDIADALDANPVYKARLQEEIGLKPFDYAHLKALLQEQVANASV